MCFLRLFYRPSIKPFKTDATFVLTVGSFLLTVELFHLQLCLLAFYLRLEFFFTYSWTFLACSWSSFAYNEKVCLRSTFMYRKQRSSTVSKEAPIVSKKLHPFKTNVGERLLFSEAWGPPHFKKKNALGVKRPFSKLWESSAVFSEQLSEFRK